MKKRVLCIALCLCLLTGALPALAQDGGALCVLNDGWFVNEDYLAQYPDRSLEMIPAEYLDNGIDTNLRELLFTTDLDVARITTDEFTFGAGRGRAAHGPDGAVREEKLYPAVREAVTVDDRMMGVPTMGWYMGARYSMQWLDGGPLRPGGKAGAYGGGRAAYLRGALRPCAEVFCAGRGNTARHYVFLYVYLFGQAGVLLLSSFIDQYAGEFADAEGNVNYDTDAFRDGVRQIDELTALLNDNLKPLYNEGSTRLYMLVSDAANHPLGTRRCFPSGRSERCPCGWRSGS